MPVSFRTGILIGHTDYLAVLLLLLLLLLKLSMPMPTFSFTSVLFCYKNLGDFNGI